MSRQWIAGAMNLRCFAAFLLVSLPGRSRGQDIELARIVLSEPVGLPREGEFIELSLQTDFDSISIPGDAVYAIDEAGGQRVPCQILDVRLLPAAKRVVFSIVFPVSLKAHERRPLRLIAAPPADVDTGNSGDLKAEGEALELHVENQFYIADLTSSTQSEGKSHRSGQLRELFIKSGFNQLLSRTENRMHWAPNFQRAGAEAYNTIAEWESPAVATVDRGRYLIRTKRQDAAPGHPEIVLSVTYKFYASRTYFRFSSTMAIVRDVSLVLLRNDEMTMDSLFTHLAFQRPSGEVVDLALSERYELLARQPIEHDAPWLCFYHCDKRYAFGSIRLKVDNTNSFGEASPTFEPHTTISDGAGGGRYWNRRLVNERATMLPRGSRYAEDNAYLVFSIEDGDRLIAIRMWAERLRNPIRVE